MGEILKFFLFFMKLFIKKIKSFHVFAILPSFFLKNELMKEEKTEAMYNHHVNPE